MIALSPTDTDWFNFLRKQNSASLVNFWTPTDWKVGKLRIGDYWYFVLKGAEPRKIGGSGCFVEYKVMKASKAWDRFGIGNGSSTFEEMLERLNKYRGKHSTVDKPSSDPDIGCIILDNCTFISDSKQQTPDSYGLDFASQIVKYKTYDIAPLDFSKLLPGNVDYLLGNEPQRKNGAQDSVDESVSSYSWVVASGDKATKLLDKSSFLHRGTGIPVDIRSFFITSKMSSGQQIPFQFLFDHVSYAAHIEMDNQPTPRTRLFWGNDFSLKLRTLYPRHYMHFLTGEEIEGPKIGMVFERLNGLDSYSVNFVGEVSQDTRGRDKETDDTRVSGHLAEGTAAGGTFDPHNEEDARKITMASIVRRRGQPAFRQALLGAYEGRCAVTGCDTKDTLEAAHILPYKGDHTDVVDNGLLLRADIHTLFDLGLIAVSPLDFRIYLHQSLKDGHYGTLHGRMITVPKNKVCWPNREALKIHKKASGL